MKKILLVGSTGQLGSKTFEKLASSGKYAIRILVREDSKYEHLRSSDSEIIFGNFLDKESIDQAVNGCDFMITTVNSAAPRKSRSKKEYT